MTSSPFKIALLAAACLFPSLSSGAQECASPRLGRSFVVGVPSTHLDPETKTFLSHVCPYGIVLYARNYRSSDQLKRFIADLQRLAVQTRGEAYRIFADLEPGGASRFGLFKDAFPLGHPNWPTIERDVRRIRELGIDVNLGPVADFPFDPDSFINPRVRSRTPDELILFNRRLMGLLKKESIPVTLKHFPGLGFFRDDPHRSLPVQKIRPGDWEDSLRIFKAAAPDADYVMMAHAVYPEIDPQDPAGLSPVIIQKLLRQELGFKGLVISDDLSEMPFQGKILDDPKALAAATLKALQAGNDLVLFSHEPDKTKKVFDLMADTGVR